MKKATRLFLLTALSGLWSCDSPLREGRDLVSFVESPESGLCKEIQVGDYRYTVQYKPAAYILYLEHIGSDSLLAVRKKQLDSMVWFNISFRVEGFGQSPLRYRINGISDYQERLHYYLNEAPRDIYLRYGKDTLYVSSYWFEHNHNLSATETMIVGFRLPQDARPQRNLQLAYYDRVFRNGIIKTIIRKEALLDLPDLHF